MASGGRKRMLRPNPSMRWPASSGTGTASSTPGARGASACSSSRPRKRRGSSFPSCWPPASTPASSSGTRTYAEQNTLFRQGRFGNKGPRVTNARGGQSNHNYGIAWDIGLFENGKYLTDSPLYKKAAELGRADGLEWGGDWTSFKDQPHYQLATGLSMTNIAPRDSSKANPTSDGGPLAAS